MKTRVLQDEPHPIDALTSPKSESSPHARGTHRSTPTREAARYITLVYTMVLGIALALPHAGIAPLFAMVTPVVSVLIITAFWTPRGQRRALWHGLGLRTPGTRMWLPAVALPVVFLTVGYGTAVILRVAKWAPQHASPAGWGIAAAKIVLGLAVVGVLLLVEEIGWRGYLLPRLQAVLSSRRAAVATGFIHALFHLPLILLTTTYDTAGNRYLVAGFVVFTITAAGVFYAWLRDTSGSLWPVSIAHGTVNLVFQVGTTFVVTTTPAALAYTAGESGLATLAGVTGCAAYLLARARCWQHHVVPNTERLARGSAARLSTPAERNG